MIPKPTVYPSPVYIIPSSQNQQFILLLPVSSHDPKTKSLFFPSLYYPMIPKPSLSFSSLYILSPDQKPTVSPPAYIIPWSQN